MITLDKINAQIDEISNKNNLLTNEITGLTGSIKGIQTSIVSFEKEIDYLTDIKQKSSQVAELMIHLGKEQTSTIASEIFSIEEPIEEPVKESVKEPIEEPVKEPVKEPVEESVKEPVEVAKCLFSYSKKDIPYQLAYDAYSASSHTPRDRAVRVIEDYYGFMEAIEIEFKSYGDLQEMYKDLNQFKDGYVERLKAKLAADTKTASSFITGAGKFPTERNEKKLKIANKRHSELLEYSETTLKKLRKKYDPKIDEPILSSSSTAIAELQERIKQKEARHQNMKRFNAVCRHSEFTEKDKTELTQLIKDLELKYSSVEDVAPGHGFPSFTIRNHYQNIKRDKERIKELEKEQKHREDCEDEENKITPFDGGVIVENFEEERLQIAFDSKPSESVRQKLKSNGFRWARSTKVWQRLLNDNARIAAGFVLQIELQLSGGAKTFVRKPTPESLMEKDNGIY